MHGYKKRELEIKRDEIITKYIDYGMSSEKLSAMYGVSPGYLQAHFEKWRYRGFMRGANVTQWDLEDDKDFIIHHYEDGETIAFLCRKIGCAHNTMVRALKRWDVYRNR